MRFLRRLTLIALLAGLVAWLRKVLSDEVLERAGTPTAPAVGYDAPPKAAPKDSTGSGASTGSSSAADADGEPSKAELYERAQELGIEGRSKMSKAELQRAISQAG